MKSYYPVFLNLNQKPVLVIGGGMVAERRVRALLEAGAEVTVISPALTKELAELVMDNNLIWLEKCFAPADLKDAFFIIAATDQKETNQEIKTAAQKHQLVNLADDPERSDFHIPSSVRRGRLTISISTSGASPILAKRIKQEIETKYDERYRDYLDFLFESRQTILTNVTDPVKKKELLTAIADPVFLTAKERNQKFQSLLKKITRQ